MPPASLESWRRSLVVAAAAVLAPSQWHRLASGRPFTVVTGIGVACFLISMLFLTSHPGSEDRTAPEVWRRRARRAAVFFGLWAVVAWAWLGAAAVWYAVRPLNVVVPAIPTLAAVFQVWTYRSADRAAQAHQQICSR